MTAGEAEVPAPGAPIAWKDPELKAALEALRALPEGAEVLADLGCEYLAASFLAANGIKPEQALEPLRQTAQWRRSGGAAAARQRLLSGALDFQDLPHTPHIQRHMPMHESRTAMDRRGLPFAVRCMGMADVTGLFEKLTEDDMLEWQVSVSEWRLLRVEACARETGRLGEVTLVQDMISPEGLLVKWRRNHAKMGIMRKVTAMMDLHYPGLLGPVILTNAPWAVHAILQVLRPVLPKRISQRIEAVPDFQTAERLRELIEPSRLPKFLGGEVPDEDFMPTRAAVAGSADKGTEVNVPAGKREERGLQISEGDIAAYGFNVAGTSSQDIMFSCRFDPQGTASGSIEVRAPDRVKEAAGGSFVAPQGGRLVLVFDNSYSWVTPKTVRYECSVLTPDAGSPPSGSPGEAEGL